MATGKATAIAGSNIAFTKYWGVRDATQVLPFNDSISMTLDALTTTTTVEFDPALEGDHVEIGDVVQRGEPHVRVVAHLDRLRALAGQESRARVVSENNFPMGAGIASSASAFAALSVAGAAALGLDLDARTLSRLARRASGSASRSLFGGFVRWQAGEDDASSYAEQICPPAHWPALRDVVAVVARGHKAVTSSMGHNYATTSPYLQARLDAVRQMNPRVAEAIRSRDLLELGPLIEADALGMHFVMMSSTPALFYWTPATLMLIQKCEAWRDQGLQVYFTIDAGPNVHLICEDYQEAELVDQLRQLDDVQEIFTAAPGPAAHLVDTDGI